jgi:Fe-S oxidoreductase
LRFRKQQELSTGIEQLTGKQTATAGNVKLLTSCPSCQQGLQRYADDTGLETDYIVVELATRLLGGDWEQRFVSHAQHGGIEWVLL